MRNFWEEDPCGDDLMLWLCAVGFMGCCLYSVFL
jgi:hypothetical protein